MVSLKFLWIEMKIIFLVLFSEQIPDLGLKKLNERNLSGKNWLRTIWLRKIDLEWIKGKTEKIIVQKDYCL